MEIFWCVLFESNIDMFYPLLDLKASTMWWKLIAV